jgi:hypothetical protein
MVDDDENDKDDDDNDDDDNNNNNNNCPFERKILRRIYSPTHEGGCWRPRWNNKLYSLYKEPNIVEDI